MTQPEQHPGADVIPLRPGSGRRSPAAAPGPPSTRVRLKKRRLLALLTGVGLLAAVSAAFGMLMAVASDLPALERLEVPDENSVLEDRAGRRLGALTGAQNRILVKDDEISAVMAHAIIAVEDRRFLTNEGVDPRGTLRALYQDVIAGKAVQGGSTITQQFVKNATAAQNERTLLNKVREAALAFHVTREWDKPKILRNYLNSIYFGNGAYGVEAAARTYFAWNHEGCDRSATPRCAAELLPEEAALLAGVVASPSLYDPLARPAAAKRRRDLVLRRMQEQDYLDSAQYELSVNTPLPARDQIAPPREETEFPYFTSWVKPQVVDKLGGGQVGSKRAFEGGLRVRTTLDSKLQEAAEAAVAKWVGIPGGPEAAVVAIDNDSGEVRAMVGGPNLQYNDRPFNLATQGQRQPGSAFKPFVLAQALEDGISPGSTWISKKQTIDVPRSPEKFVVNNYEDAYAGTTTLARATTFSDNAVYARLGIKVGTRRIARLSKKMGIRSDVSSNYAMTLGGLREGITPLDLARAYSTFANDGKLLYGTLSPGGEGYRGGVKDLPGPAAIASIRRDETGRLVELPDGSRARNRVKERRIISKETADRTEALLQTVVRDGTGVRASLGPGTFAAGKTGTTENYSDAWFVGWSRSHTVAVWVGYPEGFRPMKTEWRGDPVAGGTYPAAIWREFMLAARALDPATARREKAAERKRAEEAESLAPAPAPAPSTAAPGTPAPETAPSEDGGGGESDAAPETAPEPPAQPEAPAPDPAPAPAAPPPAAPGGGAAPEAPTGGAG